MSCLMCFLLRFTSFLLVLASLPTVAEAQSNLLVRVMAANTTSGSNQSYEAPGIRIFQGLKPDVVAIQEFKFNSSSSSNSLRQLVNTAFGTNFQFYCEPNGNIPNGIVSRWPILAAGSWDDPFVTDRDFAWARIDLPGSNDLYVVSVHLYGSGSAGDRGTEAAIIKAHIQTNFPAGAWVIVGGDMNTDNRAEAAIGTFKTFLSDSPMPDDNDAPTPDQNTNEPRNKPYDYVLPSFSFTNYLTPVVLPSQTLPNGLVFDSEVYDPLSDVAPVMLGDSHVSGMQHMAVVKDFLVPIGGTDTNAPSIVTQPESISSALGSNATFTVAATGAAPLAYQWRFFNTNLPGANVATYTRTNVQLAHGGGYSVVVTNSFGSVTSAVAQLTVSGAPFINSQPQSLTVVAGSNATFHVTATGDLPLSYQWRFGGVSIPTATSSSYTRSNAQPADAGSYAVVITNSAGSITSSVATLTVNVVSTGVLTTLAGWDTLALTNYGPSPYAPTTNAPNLTIVGLTRGVGVTTGGTAAGRTWGGNGFDAASAAAAVTASDFATFSISANSGYQVSFSAINKYDYRRSSTGPPNGVLQYQIGAGAFTDITTLSYSSTSSSGASLAPIDLSGIAALQNIAASNVVTFRIVNYGASSSGGNWYVFDVANTTAPDFSVAGIVASISVSNPPAAPPVLGSPNYLGNQFSFTVTGTTGSNYAVQSTTNLVPSFWISERTNAAPFTFTATNIGEFLWKFYRAVSVP